jgi:hypothetical protein
MCGRYRRTTSEEELARLYHIPNPQANGFADQLQHRSESKDKSRHKGLDLQPRRVDVPVSVAKQPALSIRPLASRGTP